MIPKTLNFAPLDSHNLSADLARQLRRMIGQRLLCEGDRLPSSRTLSRELGVSRGTVVTAVEVLMAEGYLETRSGAGTFVARGCEWVQQAQTSNPSRVFELTSVLPDVDVPFHGPLNFQACRPSTEGFPQNAWRRAMASAASRLPATDYGDPLGELVLRQEIAAYLCRARGLDVDPAQIIVTNGAIHAMYLLASVFLRPGDRVAFENPGYALARQTLASSGAEVLPIPVDQQGLCVDKLPRRDHGIRGVYVTPSHQFPSGERLTLDRRHQLIHWAKAHQAVVIEDDYDGEFRYDIAPLPPMAAMSTDGTVVYCGTFSKTLFPSLRVGFAAGAPSLIEAMARRRVMQDYQTNVQTQRGLAHFMHSGEFERHIFRMRRRYAERRRALRDAVARHALPATLTGTDSGLNAMLRLSTTASATQVAALASEHEVCVTPVARYAQNNQIEDDALVLGYAAVSERDIDEGVRRLARVCRQLASA